MAVYINRERASNEGSDYILKCMEKVDKYERMRNSFEAWAHDSGMAEDSIKAGLETLNNLIEFWHERADLGEV